MPVSSGYTLSIDCILKEAKFRWLKGYEVLCILQNYVQYGLQLSAAAPVDPPSGSLFLFNKRLVKFRKDGVNWRKQKDGKTVRESHEKLKVGGVKVLSCCYTRSAHNPPFQRRIYWLLDGDPSIVLVHYLALDKDSSKDDTLNGENSMDEPETPSIQYPIPSSLYLQNDNNEDEKEESATGSEELSGEEDGESPLSDSTPSLSNASFPLNESVLEFVNSFIVPTDNTPQPPPLAQGATVSAPIGEYHHLPPCAVPCLGRLAKISDFSPEWDYVDGGGKVLIMGPDFHSGLNYYVMFDQVEVPAELVQDGVLRCRTPPHFKPGYVSFCVTRGNFVLFSEVCHFEYRSRETGNGLMNMNERNFKLRIIERLERLEREVNSGDSLESITLSESIMDSLSHTLEDKFLTEEQLEGVFLKILTNLMEGIENADTLNTQDRDGFTLLHYACALRYHLLASTLISYGANVNIQDRSGNTPFHWAMKNRDQQMIKTLVDYVDLNKNCATYSDLSPSQDINFSPTPPSRTSSIESMISGIDDLGIDSSSETSSPVVRTLKQRNILDSPRPASPLTPHTRMRRALRQKEREQETEEVASPSQLAFRTYREKRKEQVEDEVKKRAARARDTVIAEKRK